MTGALLLSILVVPSSPADASGGTVHVSEGQSIQQAIDDAHPGTRIRVTGHHREQIHIDKDGIELIGVNATLSMPDDVVEGPCGPVLICVMPANPNFDDPFDPANVHLHDVTITGFTLSNPIFDTIAVFFTVGVTVSHNTVTESGCNGIWMLFAYGFLIERNHVMASADCGNIDIAASSGGTIRHNVSTYGAFAGISLDDVSDVVVHRNNTQYNCIGIVVFNSPGPLPSNNVEITGNTANRNNTVCYPFGPPEVGGPPIGVAGILVVGVNGAVVRGNTTNNNRSTDPAGTVTAGGIAVQDFVDDQVANIASGVVVEGNNSHGNATVGGRLDVSVTSTGSGITVVGNHCTFSAPDPTWCTS